MSAPNLLKNVAFIGLCLFFVLLISPETDTSCNVNYENDVYDYFGCIPVSVNPESKCRGIRQRYNCSNVRDSIVAESDEGRVTCLIDGQTYQKGEVFSVPVPNVAIRCTCEKGFPNPPRCHFSLSTFVDRVLDHANDLQSKAATK